MRALARRARRRLALELRRAAAVLQRWAAHAESRAESSAGSMADVVGAPGPPEHWLALVRARAPHFLEGGGVRMPAASAPVGTPGVTELPATGAEHSVTEGVPATPGTAPRGPAWPPAGRRPAARRPFRIGAADAGPWSARLRGRAAPVLRRAARRRGRPAAPSGPVPWPRPHPAAPLFPRPGPSEAAAAPSRWAAPAQRAVAPPAERWPIVEFPPAEPARWADLPGRPARTEVRPLTEPTASQRVIGSWTEITAPTIGVAETRTPADAAAGGAAAAPWPAAPPGEAPPPERAPVAPEPPVRSGPWPDLPDLAEIDSPPAGAASDAARVGRLEREQRGW